ncbi:hypothetical protein WAK64_08275 [Bacillus spongiae]|uniref:Uncharacterized protein n=1 Tax=Bacillus spongiae TaxID=2683610 RepID=A0ABU8HCU5_9BACI
MNLEKFFIKDDNEFELLKEKVMTIFNEKINLPEQVFSQEFGNFKFEEFDWAMSGEFWKTLKKLAVHTNDEFVLTAVIEPNPVDYFHKEFKYYNWIKMSIDLSTDNYFELLELGPEESPADAVLYNSYTVVWLSPSMKWAIWGEREYGICVIGLNDTVHHNSKLLSSLKSWRSIDSTVLSWIGANFMSEESRQKFVETIFSNYSQGN